MIQIKRCVLFTEVGFILYVVDIQGLISCEAQGTTFPY